MLLRYIWDLYLCLHLTYVEDRQRDIEGISIEFEVGNEAIDLGITDVGSIDER